jgi:segregation and condensation protein B
MENLSNIIEGILFVAGEPVSFLEISEKLELEKEEVEKAILSLQQDKKDNNSGIQVLVFNEKAQLCSNKEYADKISEVLNPKREKMLTKVVLEVCGIIAYKQPITRLEVENIRGGANCDYAINLLMENNLIEVVGRKDAVGKPILYGTTDNFLKKFNISSLSDLPDYNQLLERIKVLHEEHDNSLFDYGRMPKVEEDEEEISDEEAEEIIQGIKESREEIIEDRSKLDDILSKFSTDLSDIPEFKFDIDE